MNESHAEIDKESKDELMRDIAVTAPVIVPVSDQQILHTDGAHRDRAGQLKQSKPKDAGEAIRSSHYNMRVSKYRKREVACDEVTTFVQSMLKRMVAAAEEDVKAISMKQPAIAKLTLLDEAVTAIAKPKLTQVFLKNKACNVLSKWLAPVEGLVPNTTIRHRVLQLLMKLPLHAGHLQGTQLGHRLIYLWKYPDETEENRAAIRSIIQAILQPVFSSRLTGDGSQSASELSYQGSLHRQSRTINSRNSRIHRDRTLPTSSV